MASGEAARGVPHAFDVAAEPCSQRARGRDPDIANREAVPLAGLGSGAFEQHVSFGQPLQRAARAAIARSAFDALLLAPGQRGKRSVHRPESGDWRQWKWKEESEFARMAIDAFSHRIQEEGFIGTRHISIPPNQPLYRFT